MLSYIDQCIQTHSLVKNVNEEIRELEDGRKQMLRALSFLESIELSNHSPSILGVYNYDADPNHEYDSGPDQGIGQTIRDCNQNN